MADLTTDAVAKVLGVLSTAIKEEAALLGGLPRNMQFIKDEMDSMNGFLLHLTKTETAHDDQVRAWMKQIREVAYVGEDCVERYVRDVVPHEPGPLNGCGLPYVADLRFLLCHPKKYCLRRRLAKQILELKVRVKDVGDRRQRYGVTVPSLQEEAAVETKAEDAQEESERDDFRRALLRKHADDSPPSPPPDDAAVPPYIESAIRKLPDHVRPLGNTVVRGAWKKCPSPDDDRCIEIEMLLCALYACPPKDLGKLQKLQTKLEAGAGAEEIKRQVMVFCYSLLSTSKKSCLQYLTAFLEEKAISRTSLVRRWAAEGLVGREQGRTPEEVGERYFRDLVFRGFISPSRTSDAGTVKSCDPLAAGSIRTFIIDIAGSDNFLAELPVHLDRQIRIRQMVLRTQPPRPQLQAPDCSWSSKHMVDDLLAFLGELPEMYRLNVLDLGGCKGLKQRHIKAICTVSWLKYLCLRKTDISRLKPSLLNRLTMLETLDIRQTNMRPADIKRIFLPKLKHLLAGRYLTKGGADADTARASDDVDLATVEMPLKIGRMRNMETLSHVQVSGDATELARVARLHKLRKLGVVVHGNHLTAKQLREAIYALAGCLRSLSVWVSQLPLDISFKEEATPILILENLNIRGSCILSPWIVRAPKLANITLWDCDTGMNAQETLKMLGKVPSLRCLRFGLRSSRGIINLNFKEDVQFQALKFLMVGNTTSSIAFEAGAAPKLEKIVCNILGSTFQEGDGDLITGIDHLPELQEIDIRGNFDVRKLKDWINTTPTNPSSEPKRYGCRYLNSSDEQVIFEVPKTIAHTTLSLPVNVLKGLCACGACVCVCART